MCDNAAEHHDSATQGLGIPDSLSHPSEPPNIKDWFSSYEYESFVLETNDNFGFSDYEETQGHENECSPENTVTIIENSSALTSSQNNDGMMKNNCTQSGEENKCLNQVLDSPDSPLLSSESEPPGIENWFCSYAYESPAPDPIILSHDKETIVDKQEPCNRKRKEAEKNENLTCDERPEDCDNASTKDGKNSTENHPHNNLSNHDSVNSDESAQTSYYIEATNSEANCQREEDGFVSIKSRKDEKSMGENVKRAFVSVIGKNKKDGREKSRKILGDMTNIQPGKWKCPRKSKPDIGPPLKQLQLGQWFLRQ